MSPTSYRSNKEGSKDYEKADVIRKKPKPEAKIFGKPNVMINKNGIEIGKYINKTLNQLSANELIDITENFSNENKSTMMKKIFE